jgi:glycosyltransferase involved in cell wall biosynthesis
MSMNTVLEYMSFGLPIVMFDLIEGRNLAGDCARYATDNDPTRLAEELITVLDHPPLRRALGKAASQRAALYSWPQEKQALLGAYEELWTK